MFFLLLRIPSPFLSTYPIPFHTSWPSQSPVSPVTFKVKLHFPFSFSNLFLPGSFYVPLYLLLPNDTTWIVSKLFQRIFLNSPLGCVLLEDKTMFPWLLSLYSIPTPTPTTSTMLWLQKILNKCLLIDWLSTTSLAFGLWDTCCLGILRGKKLKVWST